MVTEPGPVEPEPDGGPVVVVVANGDPLPGDAAAHVPASAVVVAADGGARVALAAGLRVDHVVGDFDSLDQSRLAALQRAGATLHAFPADKDFTDLELALDLAISLAGAPCPQVMVLGGGGGRLDHFLANVALLSSPRWSARTPRVRLSARVGAARLTVLVGGDPPLSLLAPVGSLVSLLPQHGEAAGITTEGLRYPLHREALQPGSSRGVSNEVTDPAASVAVATGVLLIVQPHHFGPAPDPTEEPT